MKLQQIMRVMLPVALTLWLFQNPRIGFAAETTNATAPTGLYVSLSDRPERFVIDLKTNGVYTVLATGFQTNIQSGVWRWDEMRRQFLLTPGTNSSAFEYELRVLRVDPRQAHTLQWIPLRGVGTSAGVIEYVRFKRKED